MKRPLLGKTILLLAGTLLGLILAELILRIASPQIFPRHPPGMYALDPDVGYVLAPGFEGVLRRSEFRASFTTGEAGLRGADPRPRQPNTFRLLVLGDSQAWGYGVADEETFSHRLQGLLASHYPDSDVQVLNAGVPGYGTADQLSFLRSRGELLDPDVVILVFLPVNDFDENRAPAHTWAGLEDGMLIWTKDVTATVREARWLRVKRWLKNNSHFVRLASDTLGYVALRGGLLRYMGGLWETGEGFSDEDAAQTSALLRAVAQTGEHLGARTLFVFTTGQDYVLASEYPPLRSAAVVAEAAAAAGVPWIDVTPSLRQRTDRLRLYYPQDGHWTATGHRAVAEILCREIVRLGFVTESRSEASSWSPTGSHPTP